MTEERVEYGVEITWPGGWVDYWPSTKDIGSTSEQTTNQARYPRTMTDEKKTVTYPSWFIHALSGAIIAAEEFDAALGNTKSHLDSISMYVEKIPLMFEGDKIGTLHWLDDQWQFEPDETYWGLT